MNQTRSGTATKFLIGHPAYPASGPNRFEVVCNPHLAAMRLIDRGVSPSDARRCVEESMHGAHATAEAKGGIVEMTMRLA